jgi:hypothetical protein
MPVSGIIQLPATSGITIPTTAFVDDTHTSVLSVGSDNVAHIVKVSEVRSDGTHSIVNGLGSGTVIVANGQTGVADGQHIRVAQANTP